LPADVVIPPLNPSLTLEAHSSDDSTALLHELQLGNQLNESVHQARLSDFSLMLAMLSDDVREQSQFVLPQGKQFEQEFDDRALRKQFDLPEPTPLSLKDLKQINTYNQAKNISNNDMVSLRLSSTLTPNPLVFRDDAQHIAHQVMSNTSLICQAKHLHKKNNAVLNKRLTMNVEGWLKNIQTSLVKSRLVPNVTT
jgi:hypothetical protein